MAAGLRQDGRKGLLFCTGAAAVAGGLLLARAGVVVDCLLVLSVCLTAAVLVVAFSARAVQEVGGFWKLTVAATAAHLAMCAAAGKLILTKGVAGRIVELLAGAFVRGNSTLGVLIFFGGGCLVWLLIARALMSIRRRAANFAKGECRHEYALFFSGMRRGAGFMMFGAAAEACIIISVTAGGLAAGAWGEFGMSAGEGVALAVTAGAVTLAMAAGCVLGSVYLVDRARKSAQWEKQTNILEWEPAAKTVASEVVCEHENAAERVEEAALLVDGMGAEEAQWYEESREVEERCGRGAGFWDAAEMRDKGVCERIAERIITRDRKSSKVILLAAAERKELGVTAAVNIAMSLAQKGGKCLLVDMDTERDAVSRVFDVHDMETGAAKTCIGNLWVQRSWERQGEWKDQYDHVVLYSPEKNCWPRVDAVAADAMTALLFGPAEDQSIGEFRKDLNTQKVSMLEPESVTARAAREMLFQ